MAPENFTNSRTTTAIIAMARTSMTKR